MPEIEAEFQKLNRDYNIIKTRHEELVSRRESARMSRNRDNIGQEVQYRMIDPPTVPIKPTGPDRPLFLWLATGAAIGAGLGLALVLTIVDTSISTLSELRRHIDLPVLGAVTDATKGKNVARGLAGYLALGFGFASLFRDIGVAALRRAASRIATTLPWPKREVMFCRKARIWSFRRRPSCLIG